MSLKNRILETAWSHGADLVAVAGPEAYGEYLDEVRNRLKETGATGEDYMLGDEAESFFSKLSDARNALPEVRSIILLGVYALDALGDYRAARRNLKGKTARTYVYYPVVRRVAEPVTAMLREAGYQAVHGQSIPLKYVADRIGLGVYGWNGILFTRDFGSYVALRAVLTDAELEPDRLEPPEMPCEECGRCLKACPTGALYAPGKVNPARCINPLSRKTDDIPDDLQRKMGVWVCGCDICQEVCPVNRKLKPREPDPRAVFDPEHHASHRTLGGLERCPDLKDLREHPLPEMRRNAAIALKNADG